jgi:hypothetical protein
MASTHPKNPGAGGTARGAKGLATDDAKSFIPNAVNAQAAAARAIGMSDAAFYAAYPDRVFRVRFATPDEEAREYAVEPSRGDEYYLFVAVMKCLDGTILTSFVEGRLKYGKFPPATLLNDEAHCRLFFMTSIDDWGHGGMPK